MFYIDGKQPPPCGPHGPGFLYMRTYAMWIAENLHPNAELMYFDLEGFSEMPTYESLMTTAEQILGKMLFDQVQARSGKLRGNNPKMRAIIGTLYGVRVPTCVSTIVESIFSTQETKRSEGTYIVQNNFPSGGKTDKVREMMKNREFGTRCDMNNMLFHREMLIEFDRRTAGAHANVLHPKIRSSDGIVSLRQGDDVLKAVWPKMDFDISTMHIRSKRDDVFPYMSRTRAKLSQDWLNSLQQIPKDDQSAYDQMKRFDKFFKSMRGPFGEGGTRVLVLDSMGSFYTDERLNREPPNAAMIFDEADVFDETHKRTKEQSAALTAELMKGVKGGVYSIPPKSESKE